MITPDLAFQIAAITRYTGNSFRAAEPRIVDGYMSEKSRMKIFLAFCFSNPVFALVCSYTGPPETKMEDRPSEKAVDKQTYKEGADVVALIDNQLELISTFKGYALERENLAVDAEARKLQLAARRCNRQNPPL